MLLIGFRVVFGDKSKGFYVVIMSEFDVLFGIGYVCGYNFIVEVGVVVVFGVKVVFKFVDVLFG